MNQKTITKVCNNCKHISFDYPYILWFMPFVGWIILLFLYFDRFTTARCKRVSTIDVVTGKIKFNEKYCGTERNLGDCGLDGLYFSPKKES